MTNAYDMGNATPEMLRRVKALYAGSISLIDKGVGRILDALDESGPAENTMVVFVSDHGEMMGDHGMWQKGMPYEASARVPMLVRYPGQVTADAVSDDLVTLLDLTPTFLDVAERDYPVGQPLAGASLLGKAGGGLSGTRDEQIVEIGRGGSRWLSTRGRKWKYNRWLSDGWEELYDLENDPQEDRNLLLGEPDEIQRQLADERRQRLTEWERDNSFEDSLTPGGDLVDLGMAPTDPTEHRVNKQFPLWVDRLTEEEAVLMEKRGETVLNAIAAEDTFKLSALDLAAFRRSGGSLEGTDYADLC